MTSNKRPAQCERVLQYMHEFGDITTFQAITDIGCLRLASRISELRKKGHNIVGERIAVKNRYGEKCYIKRYRLEEKTEEIILQ